MAKRKRASKDESEAPPPRNAVRSTRSTTQGTSTAAATADGRTIQIITGSYDRVLHGFTVSVPEVNMNTAPNALDDQFYDTFLFTAHTSAIRCLAISPLPPGKGNQNSKLMLASGSTDERINLYHISPLSPPPLSAAQPSLPTLSKSKKLENPKNREFGSLLHHSSSITALYFPTRSKLLSSAEDSTIAVSRTRDWTVLSTIKAPIPKAVGRPSGDTAPPGGTPAGINDFAVHPSNKLMISVSKGEKCMRLWNLVTGRKASVLTFERELLEGVGEEKRARGEGRKVAWNGVGDEFAVGFEHGVIVFGMVRYPSVDLVCRELIYRAGLTPKMPCSSKSKDKTTSNALSIEVRRIRAKGRSARCVHRRRTAYLLFNGAGDVK